MSVTITYKGQGGQKCRGWLSCRYISLRLAWLWLTHECKSCLLHRANGCGSRVNFASLDWDVTDGLRPPTTRHRGATSTGLKNWSECSEKHWTQWSRKNTHGQNQAPTSSAWRRTREECVTNRGGYSFSNREYFCTLKALFWVRLVPWAEALQTEWLNSTTQT